MSQQKKNNQAAIAASNLVWQIGCTTSIASFVIIGLFFGLGYLLDGWIDLGTDIPVFALIGVIASFPLTLYAIVRLSLLAMNRTQKQRELYEKQEIDEDIE